MQEVGSGTESANRLNLAGRLPDKDDVDHRLTEQQRDALQRAYDDYRSTMAQVRGVVDLTDSDAEAVVAARLGLCEALLRTGWTAPGPVYAQLLRDAALLATPCDFDAVLLNA